MTTRPICIEAEIQVRKTLEIAARLEFGCRIQQHEQSGHVSSDAALALSVEPEQIIKTLYLKESKGLKRGIAAIMVGNHRLDTKKLENISGMKKLRFASMGEITTDLDGFMPGGVPVVIFAEKKIPVYVDKYILCSIYPEIIGSGGTPFHAMYFEPKRLVDKLGYMVEDIAVHAPDATVEIVPSEVKDKKRFAI